MEARQGHGRAESREERKRVDRPDGTARWTRDFASQNLESDLLALGPSGEVYYASSFFESGSLDIGLSPVASASECVVAKLGADGAPAWIHKLPAFSSCDARALAVAHVTDMAPLFAKLAELEPRATAVP